MKFSKKINFEEFINRLPAIFANLAKRHGAILVEKDNKVYKLEPIESESTEVDDPWASYNPKKIKAALRKFAGTWTDLDTDKMIENIYKAREEGSRPANFNNDPLSSR